MTALYDNLVRWNQRTQQFEPRLAENIESNEDYTEWTIEVRPGVTFSDGTPVNADAVIGSMNYFVENRAQDMGVIGPLWGGAEKVDEMTVQINLTDSWATFPFALGLGMGSLWLRRPSRTGRTVLSQSGRGRSCFSPTARKKNLCW